MAAPARLRLVGEAATARLGARLAERLEPGQLLALRGGLGGGKSTLARALIRRLLADPDLTVPSPSFALVQPYRGAAGPVLHADLYRLSRAAEIAELGLFDDPDAIVVVEWPERSPDLLARADLTVDLAIADNGEARTATLASPSGTFDPADLAAALSG